MGAWSVESFGNDDACDWAYELEETSDLSFLEGTLDKVLETGTDYLEAPDAMQAIAAVETIARLQGNWGERNSYTETMDKWVEKAKLNPCGTIVVKAHNVLDRVLSEESELLSLWQESKEYEAWLASIQNLKGRVNL